MLRFRDKAITTKIGIVIGIVALLMVLCSGVSLLGLAANERMAQDVIGNQEKTLFIAANAASQGALVHQRAFAIDVQSDPALWADLQAAFKTNVDDLRKSLAALKPALRDEEASKLFATIETNLNRYVDFEVKGYGMRVSGDLQGYQDYETLLLGDMTATFGAMDAALKRMVAKQDQVMTEAGVIIHDSAARTFWQTLGLSLAGLVTAVVFARLLVRATIARPLGGLTAAMSRLAGGDNEVDVPGLGRLDEVGALAIALQKFKQAARDKIRIEGEAAQARSCADQERERNGMERNTAEARQAQVVTSLARGLEHLSAGDLVFRLHEPFAPRYEMLRTNFNAAVGTLQEAMTEVSNATAAIRSGTDEISAAAANLSHRTEKQAATLEETAAALDRITATVRKTAAGSNHARKVVGAAKVDAEQSGDVVRRAVEAMSGIETSSAQIGKIIGVIDEIAFQTSLLALNAGVEAARAGDAGRGFAVVASEVRALAQRSAEAAKEIKTLISGSSAKVEHGVELVGQTGQALKRIVAEVAEIHTIVVEIAASAQEQAMGLDQVNTSVGQMDQVTQQNAAMVEQSSAASRLLAQETEQLALLIDQFDVGSGSKVSDGSAAAQSQKTKRASRLEAA